MCLPGDDCAPPSRRRWPVDRLGTAFTVRAGQTLPRQYVAASTDLTVHDAQTLRGIEQRLNNRPRKTLGWKAPIDVFAPALTGSTQSALRR